MRGARSLGLAALLLAAGAPARALDVPPLRARVNDLVGLLDSGARQSLEAKLAAHERRTGQQFALLIIPSLEGDSLEGFTIRVVEAWQLGKKGRDDGLLFLVSLADRGVRIEVGRGLEGAITDAHASRIIRNVLQPAFRAERFADGIDTAFALLMELGGGEVAAVPDDVAADAKPVPFWVEYLLPLLVFFILPGFLRGMFWRRRRGFWGAFFGGGGGGWSRGGGWSSGGGFRGGGGGFGGGGASGRW